jgi:hypothetical protein
MELELKLDSGYDTLRCVRAVTPSKIILDLLGPLSLPPQSAQRNEVHQRRKKEKKKKERAPHLQLIQQHVTVVGGFLFCKG